MKMAGKWDSETTVKFVQEYKLHECLWNFKSPKYKSKQLRETAYKNIVNIMNLPGFGVPEVKTKIKNLRSTYCQEKKKILNSKRSGAGNEAIYSPNIKWFWELDKMMMKMNDVRQRKNSFDYVCIFFDNT